MNCTESMTGTGAGYVMSAVFFGVGGSLFLATIVLWGYLCRRYGRCAAQTKPTVNQLNSARTITMEVEQSGQYIVTEMCPAACYLMSAVFFGVGGALFLATVVLWGYLYRRYGHCAARTTPTEYGRSAELNICQGAERHRSEMFEPVDTSAQPLTVSTTQYLTPPRPDVTSADDVIHGHVNAAMEKDASVLQETFDGSRMPKYRAPDVPTVARDVTIGDSAEIASVKRTPLYVVQTVCEIDKNRPPTLPVRKPPQ
ncbi:uncharacterized protein LOC128229922 isoform X2 [Mya arenaria]|uniref:uncharacterized protein LOC128229922 isoform X2 n=1 Tax=Mya arenaria TaxID=6604 RepID=UPI0022E7A77B|nr:uncharacterized protein LOC128229922 isoform X2 [Mya arenaria]